MIFVRMFCIIIIITHCGLATAQIRSITGLSSRLMLVQDRTVVLNELEVVFNTVGSLAFTENGDMVVASGRDTHVLLFDASGSFLRRIGSRGEGPSEYVNPTLVATLGNAIFVWDSQEEKLIEYKTDGEYVDELTRLTKPIKAFKVSTDRRNIAFLLSSMDPQGFLQMYDIDSEAYGDTYGSSNIEHVMLMMKDDTFYFSRASNRVLFGSPSRAVLMTVNLATGQYREIAVPDDDFEVRDSGLENATDIGSHFNQVFKFNYANSTLIGVFETSSYHVVAIQDGKYDTEDLNPSWITYERVSEDERRRVKLFFYSKSLDLVDSIESPAAVHDVIGLRMLAATGDQLVFYIQEYDEDDAVKKLTFLRLETMN